jgi:dTDP-4-dehydrorhamnose reductase
MKPRILLLGKNGKIGRELQKTIATLGELIALGSNELNLTKIEVLRENIRSLKPDLVINAAAFTDVERAEHFPDLAMIINGKAPGLIAEEALSLKIPIIHYSTNYIFDGTNKVPYLESDQANPVNVYGRSKLAGENAIEIVNGEYVILRTSWVYSFYRESFVTNILDWSQSSNTLQIVTDQISNPTWSRMLAEVTAKILSWGIKDLTGWFRQYKGIYHLTSKGHASRFEWAEAILDYAKFKQKGLRLLPALTSDFSDLAPRPLYSVLNCDKFSNAFAVELPAWNYMLMLAMKDFLISRNKRTYF